MTLQEFNKLDCEIMVVYDLGKANSQVVYWREYESTVVI